MKKILVIGSLNMDLVTMSERHPKLGETIIGKSFFQIPGGKGGNQAVAIAKLGGDVTMFGCVGKDSHGDILIEGLKKNNVNTGCIKKGERNTGIASIVVDENADNTIIVVPGANFEISTDDIDKNIDLIKNADIVLLQLEIPIDVVEYILKKSKEYNKITILNPAPAEKLSMDIIKNVDYLVPNETELELLSGMPADSQEEVLVAAKKLMDMGVKNLIVTMGKNGSVFVGKDKVVKVGIHKVKAVDPTAAGDSFIGGVIRMLAEGKKIEEAMEFGARVGAITVTKEGAQSSLPTWDEVVNYKF
ncbi:MULTISPECIES: ribokinase [Psychrilyobacter]|uniref:Ribokinase n=1 Tax=Psychrilyobacter piezotolerans TaxID=2293438 RepID=A0ABX9KGA8_9FUSO|nr:MULTISPECIES: ribokinase [Psychrilyobacter]MCS5422956.1 ribokinase [Psychrilyobacter sp. S5]NDI77708.1 ribokinase [Psychrilyobacter piezotolerans]RDE61408.1 ribokinase [Psychrilyobacter sp. S5]REI40929.1 ribokinase [Psychrilyobacter piezotolerans]